MKSRKHPIIFTLTKKIRHLALFAILSLVLYACNEETKTDNFSETRTANSYIFDEEVKLIRSQILESSQLNMLIKDQGVPFEISLLNYPGNAKNYMNSLEMATNIGVYVSDLNYLFAYEQDQTRRAYLDAIYYLAEQLDVDNAFDRKNFDFLDTDEYLTQSEKIDQSTTGGTYRLRFMDGRYVHQFFSCREILAQ